MPAGNRSTRRTTVAPQPIEQIAAQVALESVISNGADAFSPRTIEAVIANAEANNVSDFYLDMARDVEATRTVFFDR